mgnify:CR=1 FL=1
MPRKETKSILFNHLGWLLSKHLSLHKYLCSTNVESKHGAKHDGYSYAAAILDPDGHAIITAVCYWTDAGQSIHDESELTTVVNAAE